MIEKRIEKIAKNLTICPICDTKISSDCDKRVSKDSVHYNFVCPFFKAKSCFSLGIGIFYTHKNEILYNHKFYTADFEAHAIILNKIIGICAEYSDKELAIKIRNYMNVVSLLQ
jgi:hypothetical protein